MYSPCFLFLLRANICYEMQLYDRKWILIRNFAQVHLPRLSFQPRSRAPWRISLQEKPNLALHTRVPRQVLFRLMQLQFVHFVATHLSSVSVPDFSNPFTSCRAVKRLGDKSCGRVARTLNFTCQLVSDTRPPLGFFLENCRGAFELQFREECFHVLVCRVVLRTCVLSRG